MSKCLDSEEHDKEQRLERRVIRLEEALHLIELEIKANMQCNHQGADDVECGDIDDCLFHSLLETSSEALEESK